MNNRSYRLVLTVACVLFFYATTTAQALPAEAVEDPLSTVVYLLSTTDKNDKEDEKACLAKSLASVDRFEEVPKALEMIRGDTYVDDRFVAVIRELIGRGKVKEASALVSLLLERFGNDEYRLEMIVGSMIALDRGDELEKLIERLDDSDKLELRFKVVDAYRKLGNQPKALETLQKTVSFATASEYPRDRSKLALQYAMLGREPEALQLLESLSNEPQLKNGEFDVLHDVADAYRALGRYSEANEVLRNYDRANNIDETGDLVSTASRLIDKREPHKALETLATALTKLDPKEYDDSFKLGNIIDLYLKIGEIQKAEQVARSITGSDSMQQEQLLSVADQYLKAGNKTKAREILRFALEQTNKIDTTDAESGSLWTSGKWNQARYQSQIAVRYLDLRDDKEALRITAQLRKPYLRALILTEYVAINKTRIAAKKLAPYLEEAIVLLQRKQIDIFDSKKYDVYAIAARNFAEIGMAKRANEVFAEALTKLDQEMIDGGSEAGLLFSMCNIGVDFDRSKIEADENVRASLRRIIKNWEDGKY